MKKYRLQRERHIYDMGSLGNLIHKFQSSVTHSHFEHVPQPLDSIVSDEKLLVLLEFHCNFSYYFQDFFIFGF